MMSKEELLANLNTPLYEHGDVIRATDVKPATFLMWVNRRLVVPSDDSTGSGKRRLYSPADVVKIGVMKALTDFGIGPQDASSMLGWRMTGREGASIETDNVWIEIELYAPDSWMLISQDYRDKFDVHRGNVTDGVGAPSKDLAKLISKIGARKIFLFNVGECIEEIVESLTHVDALNRLHAATRETTNARPAIVPAARPKSSTKKASRKSAAKKQS